MYWPSSASSCYQHVSEIRAHLMNKQFPVYQKKALLIDRPLWCTYWRSCRHSSEIYHHSWVRIKKLSDRTRLYPVPTVYSQFLKKAQVSFILHSESQQIKINHCLISQAEKEDDETWQKEYKMLFPTRAAWTCPQTPLVIMISVYTKWLITLFFPLSISGGVNYTSFGYHSKQMTWQTALGLMALNRSLYSVDDTTA